MWNQVFLIFVHLLMGFEKMDAMILTATKLAHTEVKEELRRGKRFSFSRDKDRRVACPSFSSHDSNESIKTAEENTENLLG